MQRLIQANGQPHYGIFPSAPQHINYRDFDFRSPMGRRVGPLGKWRRFHQFQYFGLISPELIGGCALAQLSLLGVGFVYLYQPSSGRMLERRFKLPLGFGTRFSQTPDDGVCELRQGRNLLRLENRMAHREKRLLVELDDGTRIDACFSEEAPSFQPMCLCTPTAVNGWVYAQKVPACAVAATCAAPSATTTCRRWTPSPITTGRRATCARKPSGTGLACPARRTACGSA